jgi:hypothetical protein
VSVFIELPFMKKTALILLLLSITYSAAFAQQFTVKGKVIDSQTDKPLPFVNITADDERTGTATDIDGSFSLTLNAGTHQLNFSFIGYQKKTVTVNSNTSYIKVTMAETAAELQEVTIFPGENPAHRIIKKAIANKDKNNPENLPSFTYKTYSKFTATINADTANSGVDTIAQAANMDSLIAEMRAETDTASDTGNFNIMALMQQQHLFMMETVTERRYLPPSRDNETVLATRTSGFKNPLFSLLITQLQSFSFYNDYITIAGEDFLNPITKGSTNRYFFLLEDTTYNSPEDTVYIISYRPKPNYGFKPLKGVVYINSADWAIQSVIAEPVENQGTRISIEQRYKPYAPHIWFPDQLSAVIHIGAMKINEYTPVARVRTYLKDVKVGEDLAKKDISRAQVTIDELAVTDADKILAQYRVDTLSAKEERTYTWLDSVSSAENLDRDLQILLTLAQGKIPFWIFDLDLNRLVAYNDYEGFRLGLGAHTNARFSRWFKVGGFLGYGFKDKVWKFGYDAEATLHKYTNLKLKVGYEFDIFESGGIDFIQRPTQGFFADNYRRLFIPQWDETSRYYTSLTFDPTPKTHVMIKAQRENRYTVGNYYFDAENEGGAILENGFNYFEVVTGLRYSPKERYVEGPGFGKLAFDIGYPIVFLQYTRGIAGAFDSEFDYDKVDLRLEHRHKTLRLGESSIQVQGGAVLQDLPYSKMYVGTANGLNSNDFWKRSFMLADRNSFETMRFNEFLSDTYAQVMLRQDFKSLLFRREEFAPHIELVARAMWGTLRSPEKHYGLNSKAPDKGYYEAGLELNKLYSENLLSIGLGFYYRMGPYTLPTFQENFALKITSKYSF